MPHPRRTGVPSPRRRSSSAPRRKSTPSPLWGALFLVGGVALWASLSGPKGSRPVPDVWQETQGAETAGRLQSEVRSGGEVRGDLLRLEWPAHPRATEYRVRFRDARGTGPAPLVVRGNVFLYDLRSNALQLPPEFEWDVTAVLPDGSETVTPPQRWAAE